MQPGNMPKTMVHSKGWGSNKSRANLQIPTAACSGCPGRVGRAAQRLEDAAAEMARVATVVEATQQPMARRDPLRPRMDLIYREARLDASFPPMFFPKGQSPCAWQDAVAALQPTGPARQDGHVARPAQRSSRAQRTECSMHTCVGRRKRLCRSAEIPVYSSSLHACVRGRQWRPRCSARSHFPPHPACMHQCMRSRRRRGTGV
jgi:hypothetical protein